MIEVRNLHKTYKPKRGKAVEALKGINLSFEETGLVFILGKSGSGKSTLLNLLGGLDNFDEGEIIIKGKSSAKFSQSDFDSYRNTFIGFIFQEYNILNDFTVGANIALAMELQGKKPTKQALNAILSEVDLEGYGGRKPNELSGGQKQRVAIARALIKNPEIIMADEPTGALDSNTGKQVFDTLKKLSKDKLVIVVSHDREFAEEYGDRVIELADGEVISDIKKYVAKADSVSEGIQVIENKIIHIKSGYTLTEQDLSMINEYLKKNTEADSFISIHGKTNDRIRRAVRIDDAGNQEDFMDTTPERLDIKTYQPDEFKLIRSKLPLKNSLKIAAGSLKKKPFRLIMTILLSTVAFTLFALVNTMSTYNAKQAEVDSIIDTKVDYIAFQKQQYIDFGMYGYYSPTLLNDEDIAAIKKQFPDKIFDPVLSTDNMDLSFYANLYDLEKLETNSNLSYYMTRFSGIASISQESIENMNFKLNGRLPETDMEIVITEFIADTFLTAGYRKDFSQTKTQSYKLSAELIGNTITLGDVTYTIVGILDTNYNTERYEIYKEDLQRKSNVSDLVMQSEMYEVNSFSYHSLLYTTDKLFDMFNKQNIGASIYNGTTDIYFYNNDTEYNSPDFNKVLEYKDIPESEKNAIITTKELTTLAKNEIILPISAFSLNPDLYMLLSDAETMEELKTIIKEHKKDIEDYPIMMEIYDWSGDAGFQTETLKVVGVYASEVSAYHTHAIVYDGFAERFGLDTKGRYSVLLSDMPQTEAEISNLVSYSNDVAEGAPKYVLKNCTSYTLEFVNSTVEELKKPFLYVAIFFAIFAAFMLMNFISVSISYRKKEIGILRAVGARGADVFKIFFNESLMIALINWLLATTITAMITTFINNVLRLDYKMVVTILHFGIIQIALILLISVVVAFIGSFFPVYQVSRKKPIEAIRKAD